MTQALLRCALQGACQRGRLGGRDGGGRGPSHGRVFAQGWTPELQKMVGGRQDAAGLLQAVQAEYERQLSE